MRMGRSSRRFSSSEPCASSVGATSVMAIPVAGPTAPARRSSSVTTAPSAGGSPRPNSSTGHVGQPQPEPASSSRHSASGRSGSQAASSHARTPERTDASLARQGRLSHGSTTGSLARSVRPGWGRERLWYVRSVELHATKYAVSEQVATITLSRPHRLNAWTGRMHTEYRWALEQAENDRAVRVVVVTGEGRGFCAGADSAALEGHAAAGVLRLGRP